MPCSIESFIDFCQSQLSKADFISLKKIFIFNDALNVLNHKNAGFAYLSPSYYSEKDFEENLKDTDSLFVFFSNYFYNKRNDKRVYNELLEADELFMFFYENIDSFADGFLKDYFLFELNLRNAVTAFSMKKYNLPYSDKIISYEYFSEQIKKSNASDFGIGRELDFIDKLSELYKSTDLLKIEKTINEIRWRWLSDNVGSRNFSQYNVFAYAVKLFSLHRWLSLTEEKGEKVFNKVIENISNNIRFPQ